MSRLEFPTLWQSYTRLPLSFKLAAVPVPKLEEERWAISLEDFVSLSFCLLNVEVTWSEPANPDDLDKDIEWLSVQAWKSDVEVSADHFGPITKEFLVPLVQLLDDLPLDILYHSDKNPETGMLERTLMWQLLWTRLSNNYDPIQYYSSSLLYMDLDDFVDPFFWEVNVSQSKGGRSAETSEASKGKEHERRDEEAERKAKERAKGKRPISQAPTDDPSRDPESPKEEEEHNGRTSWAEPSRRRARSPSPTPSARPSLRIRKDADDQATSLVILSLSP
ncbi:hypothetical protein CBR_g42176 [Chara braunii]|uniref:Uncharacterized protein n=1 Tax=Chara braunii TaxID=69332 RepID=A0A388LXA5_CHABU|nr:hypothetical protein CBR_g42176 [Chara braunii]|eukprot:GBG86893.1 hypothetical protein CBR_g42176 [Chara braunii]